MSVQTLLVEPTVAATQGILSRLPIDDAYRIAQTYVATHVNPAFTVASGACYFHKRLVREVWRFYVCFNHSPVGLILLDVHTGAVLPLTDQEIQVMREKAAVIAARVQGRLPTTQDGFIVGEYARRCATTYLNEVLTLFFGATDPIFIPDNPPQWRFMIEFKMYDIGPFTVGTLAVDARNGDIFPLTTSQIKQIQERTSAIIGHPASTAAQG